MKNSYGVIALIALIAMVIGATLGIAINNCLGHFIGETIATLAGIGAFIGILLTGYTFLPHIAVSEKNDDNLETGFIVGLTLLVLPIVVLVWITMFNSTGMEWFATINAVFIFIALLVAGYAFWHAIPTVKKN
jgi:predicted small integral membrane protein